MGHGDPFSQCHTLFAGQSEVYLLSSGGPPLTLPTTAFKHVHVSVIPAVGTERWTSKLGKELGERLTDFAPWWRRMPETFGYQASLKMVYVVQLWLAICSIS